MANPQNSQITTIGFPALQDRLMVAQICGFLPNNIFFVNSTGGSSANDGLTRAAPKATIAQALALCTSNVDDVVYVCASHAETLGTTTQGLSFDKSGITVICGGGGDIRPTITCGAANIPGILLSGSNNRIVNMRAVGSTSQTSAGSYILSVTGTGNTIQSCEFNHGGAGPLRACGMTGASKTRWLDCTFLGTSAGPDVAIFMTSACANSSFLRNVFNYQGSAGLDSAAVFGSAGVAHAGLVFDSNVGLCMDLNMFDINGSHASISLGDSLMSNNYSVGSAAQTIANTYDAGGSQLAGNWMSDAVASAAIATGAVGAITTASQRVPSGSPVT